MRVARNPRLQGVAFALLVVTGVAWWWLSRPSVPGWVADPRTFVGVGWMVEQRTVRDEDGNWKTASKWILSEQVSNAWRWLVGRVTGNSRPASDASQDAVWVRVYQADAETPVDEQGAFEVTRGADRLLAVRGVRFALLDQVPGSVTAESVLDRDAAAESEHSERSEEEKHPLDTDVTGDGVPEVLLSEWTGGAHCCFNLYICEVVPEVRVQCIPLAHGGAQFVQADQDPALELVVPDWTLANWETSFAQSPAPHMVLKFDGDGWKPCAALMRQPSPDVPEASELAARWKRFVAPQGSPSDPVEVAPWGPLLDLIYTGHADQAWRLLEVAWPGDQAGRRRFRSGLLHELRHSPAWAALCALNGEALED